MRILFILSAPYPPREGIGTHVDLIARKLSERGHKITLAIRKVGNKSDKFFSNGSYRIIIPRQSSIPGFNQFSFIKNLEKLVVGKFDLVHYHTPLVFFSEAFSSNVFTTVHSTMIADTKYIKANSFKAVLSKIGGNIYSPFFERLLFKKSNKIIAVSRDVVNELTSLYSVDQSKISLITNSVNENVFRNFKMTRERTILFVGRLTRRKGLPDLVSSINVIKDNLRKSVFKIKIIGQGPLSNYLQKKIKEYQIHDLVEVFDYKSRKEVVVEMNKCAFLIMTSEHETGPLVVLEALATGTPIIATCVGLLNEIESDSIIEIKDSKSEYISESILESIAIFNDKELYSQMQTKTFDAVRPYFSSRNIKKLIGFYENSIINPR